MLFLIFLFLTCNHERITAHENEDVRTKVAKEQVSTTYALSHCECLRKVYKTKHFCCQWVSCSKTFQQDRLSTDLMKRTTTENNKTKVIHLCNQIQVLHPAL